MSEKELRREMAVLPISVVRELTGLSDRQIRYYDQQGLITPKRGAGKQRRYSLNDVDRLLEIADYLDAGYTISEIREVEHKQIIRRQQASSDAALRNALQDEFLKIGRFGNQSHF
ncbi:MerR family transcriptional regulator [Weissella soli]|jgi:MerR family glutamine synthetase transcriptional repressor|uniref:MerR family glutamine synthetase transcriptional repressor n=1 Tax=Weissella soli TaxID=155866 RepID=A0A288Q6W2_9LACO|nr:MerR family transcriptional regulator [Weissella soli]AOT56909.1 HTH-type transcriptional regulator [Weissella soli]MCT8395563.1 MerR family transcriptional regulator [Weissella soli]NKY83360.1 MerR family transcriptional regulator [Weissella soli]QEA35695.1 MerR family transcriptional regulator [Weissella soli]RDL05348.1 MerR family glutamine synthetase transcriptional repressor [Weissella soli]